MSEFFHMNGYGFFIWSSFAMTMALMVLEIIALKSKHRNLMTQLKRRQRLQERKS